MPEMIRPRPGTMRLIDAVKYRLPLAGVVSILHRASGGLMFVLLPFLIWLFDVRKHTAIRIIAIVCRNSDCLLRPP